MDPKTGRSGAAERAVRDTVNVLTVACRVNENCERALFWFMSHAINEFEGRTPAELVQEGKAEAVLRYLATLQCGATG
jgi:hypothetical protein